MTHVKRRLVFANLGVAGIMLHTGVGDGEKEIEGRPQLDSRRADRCRSISREKV